MITPRVCEILITTRQGQVVAGTITFDGQRLRFSASPDNTNLLTNILADPTFGVDREPIERQQDPERWFAALPYTYNGAYLRARFVGSA